MSFFVLQKMWMRRARQTKRCGVSLQAQSGVRFLNEDDQGGAYHPVLAFSLGVHGFFWPALEVLSWTHGGPLSTRTTQNAKCCLSEAILRSSGGLPQIVPASVVGGGAGVPAEC